MKLKNVPYKHKYHYMLVEIVYNALLFWRLTLAQPFCYNCLDLRYRDKDDPLTASLSSNSFQVKGQDVDTPCASHFENSSELQRESSLRFITVTFMCNPILCKSVFKQIPICHHLCFRLLTMISLSSLVGTVACKLMQSKHKLSSGHVTFSAPINNEVTVTIHNCYTTTPRVYHMRVCRSA